MLFYFGFIDIDDVISILCGVIVVGDVDGIFIGWDLVFFGFWIYLEYMGFCCEDGLFFVKR